MKKLTKENQKYIKTMFFDMIYRCLHLEHAYKYKIDIKITYDNQFEINEISINIDYLFRKDSLASNHYTVVFYDDILVKAVYYLLHNDGYAEIKPISDYELKYINLINDNMKECFKGFDL